MPHGSQAAKTCPKESVAGLEAASETGDASLDGLWFAPLGAQTRRKATEAAIDADAAITSAAYGPQRFDTRN